MRPETAAAGRALREAALRFYAAAHVARYEAGASAAQLELNRVPPLQNDGEFPRLGAGAACWRLAEGPAGRLTEAHGIARGHSRGYLRPTRNSRERKISRSRSLVVWDICFVEFRSGEENGGLPLEFCQDSLNKYLFFLEFSRCF